MWGAEGSHPLKLSDDPRDDVIYDRWLGFEHPEWLPVAIFGSKDEAIRFWNACFTSSNATAPDWAGDGSGSSLKEPWIAALKR